MKKWLCCFVLACCAACATQQRLATSCPVRKFEQRDPMMPVYVAEAVLVAAGDVEYVDAGVDR